MADSGGTKAKAFAGSIASPGIGIIKSWQGIVEIILRAVIMVLALCLLIAASTAENRVGEFQAPGQDLPLVSEGATQASAGWLLFLSVIALFYELALILLRFININVLNNNILILIIVDISVQAVLAVGSFAGAAAAASYVPDYMDLREAVIAFAELDPDFQLVADIAVPILNDIISSLGATAAFGFFLLVPLVAIVIFMLLGGVILKWNPTRAKYEAGSSGGSGAE